MDDSSVAVMTPEMEERVMLRERAKRYAKAFTRACVPRIMERYTQEDWREIGEALKEASDEAMAIALQMER
jgi:hypothetical protein